MAMAKNKTQCFTCNKNKITYPCKGCSKEFCLNHLTEHQQILNDELNLITNEFNEFKQTINEQKQNPHNDLLIKQIDQWERNSIGIIQQKAQECRKIVLAYSQTIINDIKNKFNNLSEQIKQIHQENEFNEINLNYLRNQLIEITQELNNPTKISIKEDSQPFINEILIISSKSKNKTEFHRKLIFSSSSHHFLEPKFNKWKQNAITVAGRNEKGQKLNQRNSFDGICIDKNKNIFIAEYYNHRIVEWKSNAKEGLVIAGGNGEGTRMDQLKHPTDMIVDEQNHSIIIADYGNRRIVHWLNRNQQIIIEHIDCFGLVMDKHGFLYVSDCKKNEVKRWKMGGYNNEGIVVAGGNEKGDQLNQLNCPSFIFVDEHESVYVSDRDNHRVIKWIKDAKEGRIVAGGNSEGRNLNQLSYPQGVVVDHWGKIYVADCWNNQVMRWCEGKAEGEIVVGGNGQGNQLNQLNRPMGLSFDDEGNLYVADGTNCRIEKFEIIL
ncbi:unnamed protein product [Adineta steineri]|uniref:Uncharacterized protein n=1 Tax=Adineta steineri TaxID=433720 RepID=A0A814TX05_9BILA|nr:unnamed protein product [Adineta steineri]